MKSIEELVTNYTNEINSGKSPNKNKYIEQCSTDERTELSELLEIIDALKTTHEPIKVRPEKAKSLFKKLESMRVQESTDQEHKIVANFRKGKLTEKDSNELNDKIDSIWNKVYGDESDD